MQFSAVYRQTRDKPDQEHLMAVIKNNAKLLISYSKMDNNLVSILTSFFEKIVFGIIGFNA